MTFLFYVVLFNRKTTLSFTGHDLLLQKMPLLFTATHHTNKQSQKPRAGDFQKNPPSPGVLNVQFPTPIPTIGWGPRG